MRITADRRIEVNEGVDVSEAAQKVLDAMQGLLTPQRTWVGLTDEEIKKISKKHKWHEGNVAPHLMPVFRSLEAKLKEKNT